MDLGSSAQISAKNSQNDTSLTSENARSIDFETLPTILKPLDKERQSEYFFASSKFSYHSRYYNHNNVNKMSSATQNSVFYNPTANNRDSFAV